MSKKETLEQVLREMEASCFENNKCPSEAGEIIAWLRAEIEKAE